MFEVEKKFLIDDEAKERLIAGAEFIGEIKNIDHYFDTSDFVLTKSSKWLRLRNGEYELKLPVGGLQKRVVSQYQELIDESEILKELKIGEGNLEEALRSAGYQEFAKIETKRSKYKKGIFSIDVDVSNFGDSIYAMVEIELMVEHENEIEAATDAILKFAQEEGLLISYVRGKVFEYIYRKHSEHYKILVEAWGMVE